MSNTSHYPWPVLNDGDAVDGIFEAIPQITLAQNTINIRGSFNLSNKTIQGLIDDGDADFVLQVLCGQTLFRRCFHFNENQFEVSLAASDLRGTVRLDYFVLASTDIPNYVNETSHPDYGGSNSKVTLGSGDKLAVASNSDKFDAGKTYAGSRGVSDILEVKRNPELNGPMVIQSDGDKIIARLPSVDFDKLSFFSKRKTEKISSVLHSGVAFPAILIALQNAFDDEEAYSQHVWFNVIKEHAEKSNITWSKEYILPIVQGVLNNPVSRLLSGLSELTEITDQSESTE